MNQAQNNDQAQNNGDGGGLSPVQVIGRVKRHTDEYGAGSGPDREAEDLALCREVGLPTEKVVELWATVRRERQAKEAKKILRGTQPGAAREAAKQPSEKEPDEPPKDAAVVEPVRLRRLAPLDGALRPELARVVEALKGKALPPDDDPVEPDEPVEDEPADDEGPDYEGSAEPVRALVPWVEGHLVPIINLPVTGTGAVVVEQLNRKHAVIGSYGGKCAVLSWELGREKHLVPVFQTFTDFRNRYMNRYVKIERDEEVERIAAGKYWLASPGRRTYDGVVFDPGQGTDVWGNRLNLWRGFALVPKRGSWRLLLRHIYRVLGNGDWEAGRYVVRWIAWCLQNPGRRAEAVLVFKGGEGAGKGTLARALLKIFGAAGLPVSDSKHLTGGFSGHLQHCVFLFLDEAFWAGNISGEGRLKALITEEQITIEPKYFTPFAVTNMLHIMVSSNGDWVVPVSHDARRYEVLEVSEERIGDFEYFDALNEELDGGGIEAMMYDLLRLDLRGWHPKRIYRTAALQEQKQHSLRELDAWIEMVLQRGSLPMPLSDVYPNRCLSKDLEKEAKQFAQYTNRTRIAKKLKELFAGMQEFNIQSARGWVFPSLADCRQAWEARNGGQWEWHHDVKSWGTESEANVSLLDV
jgi:hypothetical protein